MDAREILHVATPHEWAEARHRGTVAPPSLATEGFVHCSTREQIPGTLTRLFAGGGDLVLLVLDAAAVGDLRWEALTPGEPFPHVYNAIPLAAVRSVERVTAPGS
jgi:glutathione S-transferase